MTHFLVGPMSHPNIFLLVTDNSRELNMSFKSLQTFCHLKKQWIHHFAFDKAQNLVNTKIHQIEDE